ncbi:hypothetical protein AB1L05_10535 [Cytobacillus horneckiae]|uniref:hypothetical protein n=1 Tax=Cytobacillus horneckiae TaxID=549687 RepID=UPI000AAB4003|nr:hypothetical protein [Cytobacillus horneckiae]MEC1157464.1 hypothetical protein [Cytobacillus horneckiae]
MSIWSKLNNDGFALSVNKKLTTRTSITTIKAYVINAFQLSLKREEDLKYNQLKP